MKWTPESTIAAIENTWGQYKPGMKAVIKSHLTGSSGAWLEATFEVLTESHSGGWPPTKADMIAQHEEIKNRAIDKCTRVDIQHRLTQSTEEYVSPEVGIEMIRTILEGIGKKAPQKNY